MLGCRASCALCRSSIAVYFILHPAKKELRDLTVSPLCSQHPGSLLLLLVQDSSRLVKRLAPCFKSVFSCFGRLHGSNLAPGLCRARRNKLLMSGATCGVTVTKPKKQSAPWIKKRGQQKTLAKTLNVDVKKQQWSVEDTVCPAVVRGDKNKLEGTIHSTRVFCLQLREKSAVFFSELTP